MDVVLGVGLVKTDLIFMIIDECQQMLDSDTVLGYFPYM